MVVGPGVVGLDVASRDQLEAIAVRDLRRVDGLEVRGLIEQHPRSQIEPCSRARTEVLREEGLGLVRGP